ncbi:MAG TPA: class I SAM-dependent methyltransferase [Acidobacteriaceae bacterium]|nr:class I SAM-dependent methyltransferase [Acidobacteriaceae bacterium]
MSTLIPSYTLLRCSACSHVWLSNPPSADELSRFYGPEYHQAVSCAGEGDAARWGGLLKTIQRYRTKGALLDIGCSTGGFLSHLSGGAWQLAGIELSAEAAERARTNSGGQIMTGSIGEVEFPPNSFDVITCNDVLEHLHEPRIVFEKVAGWLKPDGIFYVFVPNVLSWEARLFQSFWYGLDLPRHLHFFSPSSLNSLSSQAGLETLRIATPPGNYLEQSTCRLLTWLVYKATGSIHIIDMSGRVNPVLRVVRKGLRIVVGDGFGWVASMGRAGPSLQAVFQKRN